MVFKSNIEKLVIDHVIIYFLWDLQLPFFNIGLWVSTLLFFHNKVVYKHAYYWVLECYVFRLGWSFFYRFVRVKIPQFPKWRYPWAGCHRVSMVCYQWNHYIVTITCFQNTFWMKIIANHFEEWRLAKQLQEE